MTFEEITREKGVFKWPWLDLCELARHLVLSPSLSLSPTVEKRVSKREEEEFEKTRRTRHVYHKWSTRPDPQTYSSDHYSRSKVLFFCEILKSWDGRTDGQTDTTCENSDHYRPWLWVGLMDQKCPPLLPANIQVSVFSAIIHSELWGGQTISNANNYEKSVSPMIPLPRSKVYYFSLEICFAFQIREVGTEGRYVVRSWY